MSILVCMYHLQNYLMEFNEIWYWRSTVKLKKRKSYWTDVSYILNKNQIIHNVFTSLFDEQKDWTIA